MSQTLATKKIRPTSKGSKAGATKAGKRAKRPAQPSTREAAAAQRPSLGQVLENLGASVVSVITAPRGLDVPVADPFIYDPLERSKIDRDAIVLGVGLSPGGVEARQLVADAVAAGASVAVMKTRGGRLEVIEQAESDELALVTVPDEMSWTHLHEVLKRACASRVDPAGVQGISNVPTGDLFSLSNAIATMMNGAVSVEDHAGRVLAYSNLEHPIDDVRRQGILGRKIVDTPGNREVYARLWATEGVLYVKSIADLELDPRLAVAVRAGDQILGSIWVIAPKHPSPRAKATLEDVARIAAVHMIQARASRDLERRMRAELVHTLLEGRGTDSVAARLGISPHENVVVMAFELGETDRPQEELYRERLLDLIAVYCEAYRRPAACVAMGRSAYVIISVPKRMTRERIKKLAREIAKHATAVLDHPLRVAIGSTVANLADITNARREADRVLLVMLGDSKKRDVASIEDVRSQAILLELRDLAQSHPELMQGQLQKVLDHDAARNTEYGPTIRAYLEMHGDVSSGAARLGVHPNTFRYRLRRIREVFDLDLQDADERLVMALQLRLLKPAEVASVSPSE